MPADTENNIISKSRVAAGPDRSLDFFDLLYLRCMGLWETTNPERVATADVCSLPYVLPLLCGGFNMSPFGALRVAYPFFGWLADSCFRLLDQRSLSQSLAFFHLLVHADTNKGSCYVIGLPPPQEYATSPLRVADRPAGAYLMRPKLIASAHCGVIPAPHESAPLSYINRCFVS
jgi:hypothetical protein